MSLLSPRKSNDTAALLIGGIALGAAIMYILDPDKGRRRRALARDKAVRAAHKTGDVIGSRSRDLSNRARGIVAEARSSLDRANRGSRESATAEQKPGRDRGNP